MGSKFLVEISTDNAAWRDMDGESIDPGALAGALRELAERVEGGTLSGVIHDFNGNRSGTFRGEGF
jgi:hypothetical protein